MRRSPHDPTETPSISEADRCADLAEDNLTILAELRAMGMVVARAYAHAAVAAAHAVEVILADELWQPETGRARALAGSKDAADSYQKAVRSVRLTIVLQTAVSDGLRDLRAGVVHAKPVAGPSCIHLDDGEPEAEVRDTPDAAVRSERNDRDVERLVEFDRPDSLPRALFRDTVDDIAADLGASVDWTALKIVPPHLGSGALNPEAGTALANSGAGTAARETALSP